MDRNHKTNQVVIAKELYEELLIMAADGGRYTTSRIERHVRKFNPHLQPARQQYVRKLEINRTRQIQDTRKLVAELVGKKVFARVKVFANSDQMPPVYTEVVVKRINSECRWLVDVIAARHLDWPHPKLKYQAISPYMLVTELPENYIPGVGVYRDTMVLKGSDCDKTDYMKPCELGDDVVTGVVANTIYLEKACDVDNLST